MNDRDDIFPNVDWLDDAFAADGNPGFVSEFRAWVEKQETTQRPLAEVVRGWSSSWMVH